MIRVVILLALAAACSPTLGAQVRLAQPAGVVRVRREASPLQIRFAAAADSLKVRALPARVLLGTGGAVAGAFIGAVAGQAVLGRDCSCDDPGLAEALEGGLVGAVVAGAAMSALPRAGSHCGYLNRLWRAAIGSTLGAGVGIVVSGGSGLILASFPLGTGLGGALGASTC